VGKRRLLFSFSAVSCLSSCRLNPRIPLSQNPPFCKPFIGYDRSGHEISWRMSLGDLMTLDMLTQQGGSDAKEAQELQDIFPFPRIVPLRRVGDVGWT
jgi:hypothetical protein